MDFNLGCRNAEWPGGPQLVLNRQAQDRQYLDQVAGVS